MGKKNKVQVPNTSNIANRDIIQRLNFLYQASVYLNGISATSASASASTSASTSTSTLSSDTITSDNKNGRRKRSRRLTTGDLSGIYIKTMKIVGQKTTVKIDPSVKRTLCKGCNTVLIPGSTATVRIKSSPSHGHAVTYTCISCKTSRRIPAPPTDIPNSSPSIISTAVTSTTDAMHIDTDSQSGPQPTSDSLIDGSQLNLRQQQSTNTNSRRKKKEPPVPRPLPFFERGHVVFRGNEILNEDEDLEM